MTFPVPSRYAPLHVWAEFLEYASTVRNHAIRQTSEGLRCACGLEFRDWRAAREHRREVACACGLEFRDWRAAREHRREVA